MPCITKHGRASIVVAMVVLLVGQCSFMDAVGRLSVSAYLVGCLIVVVEFVVGLWTA